MHLGIIKIIYNRTATHFMDDRFVNLGEEVILTLDSRIQSVYCHVHSEEKQVSLYNEILSLLSTLNAKTVQIM